MPNCQTFFAKHLRERIAKAGIKARVNCMKGSDFGIHVYPIAADITFDEAEQRAIREIASMNGMTLVRGLPIVIEQMTDPWGMYFYLTDAMIANWRANIDRYGVRGTKFAA